MIELKLTTEVFLDNSQAFDVKSLASGTSFILKFYYHTHIDLMFHSLFSENVFPVRLGRAYVEVLQTFTI